jgi:hypothetical protein
MTVKNWPQQNGVAERANCTLEEHTTSMLEQAGLPDSFRGEAVGAFVHVHNIKCIIHDFLDIDHTLSRLKFLTLW